MASSTSAESSSTSTLVRAEDMSEARPQAGPLPSKRGEIGFEEDGNQQETADGDAAVSSMPARHPADRDGGSSSSPSVTITPAEQNGQSRPPSPAGSMHSMGKLSLISFLRPRRIPTILGLRATTLAIFCVQICMFAATIAGWVLVTEHLAKSKSSSNDNNDTTTTNNNNNNNNDNTNSFSGSAPEVFMHVAFALIAIVQLILGERTIFRLRAERYCHLHPGEMLPSSFRRADRSVPMALAPWHRPPLPTYAAALAQSGVGTGDVEDNMIAVAPPPAYGNTRGSTLLLAGFMNDAMRAYRTRGSTGSLRASLTTVPESRPVSYVSQDPHGEERADADRAARLEETLARLEAPEQARTR